MRILLLLALNVGLATAGRGAPRPLGPLPSAASPVDVAAASARLARALEAALKRNGTLEEARASHEASPVGGGEVLAFEWMLAEALRLQRAAFRRLLESADRLTALSAGFERSQLVLDLLDRMVAFRKANRKLGRTGEATLPSPSLPRLMDALDRTLAEMDRRVGELRPLVEAAL